MLIHQQPAHVLVLRGAVTGTTTTSDGYRRIDQSRSGMNPSGHHRRLCSPLWAVRHL